LVLCALAFTLPLDASGYNTIDFVPNFELMTIALRSDFYVKPELE